MSLRNHIVAARTLTMALALGLATPILAHQGAHPATTKAQNTTQDAAATQDAVRDLWIGHIFWVRNVVTATLMNNAGSAEAAEQQVVANAKAIAGAIEPFYGKPATEKLFNLLAGHYGAIKDYLDATKGNSKPQQDAALKTLTTNAGEIATFLSSANPNLPLETLRALLSAHGAHHVQQIQQLKAGQYDAEAKTWTAMKDHMYTIADALTQAIAKQFPQKFA